MKKFLFLILFIVVLPVVGAYLYLDQLAKHAIETYGSKALGVQINVERVKLHLTQEKFIIKNISIANPPGYKDPHIMTVNNVTANLDLRTIFDDIIIIRNITIDEPQIFYSIGPKGDNIKALRHNIPTTSSSGASNTKTELKNSGAPSKVVIQKFFLNKTKVTASIENVAEKSLILPDIYIQNIGQKSNGVTVEKASEQVLRELSKSISKVNLKSLLKDLGDLPNNLDNIKSKLDEKLDGLKSDFKKLF